MELYRARGSHEARAPSHLTHRAPPSLRKTTTMTRTAPAMARKHPRKWAPMVATSYIGLITLAGLVRGITGAEGDGYLALLYFLSFPGSLLVSALVVIPLNWALGGSGTVPHDANPFGPMIYLTGGAVVNVLLVWCVFILIRRLSGTGRRTS